MQQSIKTAILKYFETMKKLFFCICIICAICACNVTRVVTTSSEYHQRNDTSVIIQTKTIETYNGEIKR